MLRKFWAGEKAGVLFKYSMSHQFYIIKTDELPRLFFFISLFFFLSFKNLVNSLLLVAFTGFVGREVRHTGLWLLRSLFKQLKSFRVQYLTFPEAEMDWNDRLHDRHDSFVIWSKSSFTFLVLSWPVIILFSWLQVSVLAFKFCWSYKRLHPCDKNPTTQTNEQIQNVESLWEKT